MPCRDYGYDEFNRTEDRTMRDKLARIACLAMRELKKHNIELDNQEAADWFLGHEIMDAAEERRKKAEIERDKAKKLALKKLTKEERKLLGI